MTTMTSFRTMAVHFQSQNAPKIISTFRTIIKDKTQGIATSKTFSRKSTLTKN